MKKIIYVIIFILFLFTSLYLGIAGFVNTEIQQLVLNKPVVNFDIDTILSIKQDNVEAFNLDTTKSDSTKKLPSKGKIVYNGMIFENKHELEIYLNEDALQKYFPFIEEMPNFMSLVITAFSFGILGGLINISILVAIKNKKIEEVKMFSITILGGLIGIIILGLSYILPTILISNATQVRPTTLMFLCMFCAIQSENFVKWLFNYFDKLFDTENTKNTVEKKRPE